MPVAVPRHRGDRGGRVAVRGLVARLQLARPECADRAGARAEFRHRRRDRPGPPGRCPGAHRRRGAAAHVTATGSASWQQVGATQGLSRASTRGGSTTTTIDIHNYSLTPLNVAYEVDFWGKNRAARQAAVASAMFSRFDQQVVALTVVTNVANTWFTALALADRLAVAQQQPGGCRTDAGGDPRPARCRHRQRAGYRPAGGAGGRRAGGHPEPAQPARAGADRPRHPGRPAAGGDHRPARLARLRCRCRRSRRACRPACWSAAPTSPRPRRSCRAEFRASRWRAPRSSRRSSSPGRYGFANAALNTLFSPGGTLVVARRRVDPAAVRCRHAARAAGTGEGALRRVAGRLPQGGGAGLHRCGERADRLALHHRAGGAAAPGGGDGAAGCRHRAGPDAGGHRRHHHGADRPRPRCSTTEDLWRRCGWRGSRRCSASTRRWAAAGLSRPGPIDGPVPGPAAGHDARRRRAAGRRQRPVIRHRTGVDIANGRRLTRGTDGLVDPRTGDSRPAPVPLRLMAGAVPAGDRRHRLCDLVLARRVRPTRRRATATPTSRSRCWSPTAEQKDVPIYLDGLGTVQAFNTVTVKPMVDGPLITVNFTEGQDVKKGDVLAQIDPRTYQAALDQAVGEEGAGRGAACQRPAGPGALPEAGGEQLHLRPAGRHGEGAGGAARGAGDAGPGADRHGAHPAQLHHDHLAARRAHRHAAGRCRQHRARRRIPPAWW